MAKLTSTTYALLGLLSNKPWTAYELTKYMQTSAIRVVWPRAESGIFREPKKLVEEGLATVRHEQVNNRLRAVYTITAKGRIALQDWLDSDSEPAKIEYESMLKLLQMDVNSPDLLGHKVEEMAEECLSWKTDVDRVMARIASQGFTLEGRGTQSVLANILVQRVYQAIFGWTELAKNLIEEIPDDLDPKELDEWALEKYRAFTEQPGEKK